MDRPQMTPGVRIAIDGALCTASGICVSVAPDLFSLPSGAYCAAVASPAVAGADQVALAEEAAAFCPTQAILVTPVP